MISAFATLSISRRSAPNRYYTTLNGGLEQRSAHVLYQSLHQQESETKALPTLTSRVLKSVNTMPPSCPERALVTQPLEQIDWSQRIQLIQRAAAASSVFSFSIVPANPTIYQTWYRKKVPSAAAQDPPQIGVVVSSKRADNQNRPGVLSGFFAPYPSFSSDLATPQFDPQHLPSEVQVVTVCSKDQVESALSKIGDNARPEITGVLTSFLHDNNSTGLGLQIVERGNLTRLYANKEWPNSLMEN
jgi:hypothetical protein